MNAFDKSAFDRRMAVTVKRLIESFIAGEINEAELVEKINQRRLHIYTH
jgi:hypothetical protein